MIYEIDEIAKAPVDFQYGLLSYVKDCDHEHFHAEIPAGVVAVSGQTWDNIIVTTSSTLALLLDTVLCPGPAFITLTAGDDEQKSVCSAACIHASAATAASRASASSAGCA